MMQTHVLFSLLSICLAQVSATYSCKARNPAPSGVLCKSQGYFVDQPTSDYGPLPTYAQSFDECVHIMMGINPGFFSSFTWSSKDHSCSAYDFDVTPGFNATGNGTTYVSHTECYKCKVTCPEPAGTSNILVNGDFNLSKTLYGPWQVDTSNYSFAQISSASTARAVTLSGTGPISFSQFRQKTCKGGELYKLTFDYRIDDSATPPYLVPDVSGAYASVNVVPNTPGVWHSFEDFVALEIGYGPGGADIQVRPEHPTDSLQFSLASIHLAPVGSPTSLAPVKNTTELVRNGGFESGSLAPWSISLQQFPDPFGPNATAAIVKPGLHSSSYALRISAAYYDAPATLTQNIVLAENVTYLFSFDYTTNRAHSNGNYEAVKVMLSDASGDISSQYTAHLYRNGSHTFKTPVVARAGYTVLSLELYMQQAQDTTDDTLYFEIDNVSVKQLDLSTIG